MRLINYTHYDTTELARFCLHVLPHNPNSDGADDVWAVRYGTDHPACYVEWRAGTVSAPPTVYVATFSTVLAANPVLALVNLDGLPTVRWADLSRSVSEELHANLIRVHPTIQLDKELARSVEQVKYMLDSDTPSADMRHGVTRAGIEAFADWSKKMKRWARLRKKYPELPPPKPPSAHLHEIADTWAEWEATGHSRLGRVPKAVEKDLEELRQILTKLK